MSFTGLVDGLLGPMDMHFRCARAAYEGYLANARSFLWASSLKRINSSARSLLLAKGCLLPEELKDDAVSLVRHYDIWLTLWEELAQRTKPTLDEPFVFQNSVTYPREAEDGLTRLYQELRDAGSLGPVFTSGNHRGGEAEHMHEGARENLKGSLPT